MTSASPRPVPGPPPPPRQRVAVFIDYQNAHFSGLQTFCDFGTAPELALVDPVALAETVVGRRRFPGFLSKVHVYRGRPNPEFQRNAAAANDRQAAAWSRDGRVAVHRRPLWYPRDYGALDCTERPREKGIDVALAVDMVEGAINQDFDVAVLFSRDTDLMPAVETVWRLHKRTGVSVEVATWAGASRLRFSDKPQLPFCHNLNEYEWQGCRDHTDYLAEV